MSTFSSPPKPKTPLPMVPVPKALETVLMETARSLWFNEKRHNGGTKAPSTVPPSHLQKLGRLSASDVKAPSPGYPDHNASIMDGYAVKTSDLAQSRDVYDGIMDHEDKQKFVLDFVILGKVYAGDDEEEDKTNVNNLINSNHRTAVYITTGAVVPTGYDAVIPIEDTEAVSSNNEDHEPHKMQIIPSKIESVLNSTKPMTWIRPVGCDIPPESVVLSKGEKIQPVHMALLAQVGISMNDVHVKDLPRVGVLSTGNELFTPSDSQQSHGKIPDANRPMLLAQLTTYENCSPIDLGIVTDDDGFEQIAQRLNALLWSEGGDDGIDVLITTGGISMGEKDIMEQVFVEGMGGKVHFGRMNMKPGKPTTFITIDRDTNAGTQRKIVFALPGNPVSASVCTELLVRPCLDLLHDGLDTRELSDDSKQEALFVEDGMKHARVHEEVMAATTSDIKLDPGRPEYRRVTLQRVPSNTDGGERRYTYNATSTGVQRSSRVLSLRGADGLMMLPRGGTSGCGYDIARKGMQFPVLLYSSSSPSKQCFKDSMHRDMCPKGDGPHHAHKHYAHKHYAHKHHAHKHHEHSTRKLSLGVIICKQGNGADEYQDLVTTLVHSLGGDSRVSVAQKAICKVDDTFVQLLPTIVSGPQMEGVSVIFVIVPTDPLAEITGNSAIAFKMGLEVSHALRPILTKNAPALALQMRTHAALHDPAAALFENVIGTVRDGSSLLITCSDRGLEGAVGAVKASLGHLISLIGNTG